jgi:hypothetical protein
MCATSGIRIVTALLLAWVVYLGGCGNSSPAGDAGIDAGDPGDASPADADVPGGIGAACSWASQCRDGLICDPDEGVCAEAGACSSHAECGRGAHCADDGTCATSRGSSPCDADEDCQSGDRCVAGSCGCRGEVVEAELRDVNMMIVLDRSGSMWEGLEGHSAVPWEETKWYIAMTAIDGLLSATVGPVHFGLVLFPHSEATLCSSCQEAPACMPGNVLVDVGPDTGDAIRDELDSILPECCTPTGATLSSYLGYEPLADPEADNYLLLIADGRETCGGDAVSAAAALREQEPPVRTFVVGFGGGVDPDELSGIAHAGGTARDGDTAYYQADDQAALEEAFADIAVEAFSCVHRVDGPVLDLDAVKVYADGELLPRDPAREHGWDYDRERNELSFHGAVCEALQAGEVGNLAYVQSCELEID